MLPIILALLCAFLNSLSKIVFRFVMRREGDVWVMMIMNNLIAGIFFLIIRGFPSVSNIDSNTALRFLCGGILWVLAGIGDVHSHKHLDVAVNAIFGTLRYALLAIACVFIFGEHLGTFGILGVALIIVSVISTIDMSSLSFRLGALYRLMALIFCNFAILNDKYLLKTISPDLVISFAFLLPGLIVALAQPKSLTRIPVEIRKSHGWILMAPLFQILVYGAHVYSMSMIDLVVTATIAQTTVVFTYIFGIVFLKEREQLLTRGLAALLCAMGAVLVALK